jgi:hypothetical protein
VISVDSAATYLRQEALLSRDGTFFGLGANRRCLIERRRQVGEFKQQHLGLQRRPRQPRDGVSQGRGVGAIAGMAGDDLLGRALGQGIRAPRRLQAAAAVVLVVRTIVAVAA